MWLRLTVNGEAFHLGEPIYCKIAYRNQPYFAKINKEIKPI